MTIMLYANLPTSDNGLVTTSPFQHTDSRVVLTTSSIIHSSTPQGSESVATVKQTVDEKPPPQPQSPADFLKAMFARNPHSPALLGNADDLTSFARPTQEATDAYDMTVVQAIRHNDMDRLREMLREGKSFNACNRFGESLIHMVCRRGNVEIASFLINEAGVDVDVRDDFGRSCLHDACWTSKPNLEMMDLLLNTVSPEMLLAEDVRGHTPFNYARKEHYEEWVNYLNEKEEELQHRITTYALMR